MMRYKLAVLFLACLSASFAVIGFQQVANPANPPVDAALREDVYAVYSAMSCGVRCGEGGWKVFEKVGGQWRPYRSPSGRPPCPPDWIA